MKNYKADYCKATSGHPFVYVEPSWILSPKNADGWVPGVHIGTCYYMTAEDADDLAAQLVKAAAGVRLLQQQNAAADAIDAATHRVEQSTPEE